jgi:superfamily II DNA/RNA helicase
LATVDAYSRGLPLDPPVKVSQPEEVRLLSNLYEKNLGTNAAATVSARLGVFTHHGNTPHGLRLSVEHAMKTGTARFVICTSTLAQGVNLPIRYLIVTSIYQGSNRIKVRDFHNLIGRAGRSGMHTEGSVLFADPDIYDHRDVWRERWRWLEIGKLLQPDQSEPCDSSLLSIFEPLRSDNGREELPLEPMEIPRAYIAASESPNWVSEMASKFGG